MIPNYLEPGIEAKISKTKDLKFINTNNTPASLKISMKDSELISGNLFSTHGYCC